MHISQYLYRRCGNEHYIRHKLGRLYGLQSLRVNVIMKFTAISYAILNIVLLYIIIYVLYVSFYFGSFIAMATYLDPYEDRLNMHNRFFPGNTMWPVDDKSI